MARLYVLSGDSIGRTFTFDGRSTIGRAKSADLSLPEVSVSREHAVLEPAGEPHVWRIVDLESSNGVHVGGERVTEAVLRDGETFSLGDIELRLRDEAAVDTEGPEPEPELEVDDDDNHNHNDNDNDNDDDDDDALEITLEVGDDLDRALEAAPKSTRQPSAQEASKRTGTPAGPPMAKTEPVSSSAPSDSPRKDGASSRRAKLARTREMQRAEALGGAGGARATDGATGGRPILQYSQPKRTGIDLDQVGGWRRGAILLAGLVVLGAVAYGAFALVQSFRGS